MFSQLLKLVYVRVTLIPSGIVPVQLLLAHHYRCGLILPSTSKLKVRHLTDHCKDTSKFLLSPLLRIFNVNGGSLNNYTHIHTTLKTVTATKNRQGFVLVALPEIKRRQSVLLPKHSRPVQNFVKWDVIYKFAHSLNIYRSIQFQDEVLDDSVYVVP